MNLKELSDFQIGQVKGYLACKNKENLSEQLELEQNLDTRSGMRWAYNKYLKQSFTDSAKEFCTALKESSPNAKFLAFRINDYKSVTSADEGRYQIVQNPDGSNEIQEVYSEDEIDEVKERLDNDPNLTIASQDEDGSIWLARKQDSNEEFHSIINQMQLAQPEAKLITSENAPLRALFVVAIHDVEKFENSLQEFAINNSLTITKVDTPELVYVVESDKVKCTIACVSQTNEVAASIYYMSAPWFISFLNELAYQASGKVLTPSGVFDGIQFVQFDSEQEVFDSLGVSELSNVKRY